MSLDQNIIRSRIVSSFIAQLKIGYSEENWMVEVPILNLALKSLAPYTSP